MQSWTFLNVLQCFVNRQPLATDFPPDLAAGWLEGKPAAGIVRRLIKVRRQRAEVDVGQLDFLLVLKLTGGPQQFRPKPEHDIGRLSIASDQRPRLEIQRTCRELAAA